MLETSLHRTVEKSALRDAVLAARQIDADMALLKETVARQCREAARRLRTAIERVRATRRARDLQARKLALEKEKLRQGRSSTRTILDYQDDLEYAEWSWIRAIGLLEKSLANWRRVQGLTPVRLADEEADAVREEIP